MQDTSRKWERCPNSSGFPSEPSEWGSVWSQCSFHPWAGVRGSLWQVYSQSFTLSINSVVQAKPRYRGFSTDPAPGAALAPTGRAHPGPAGHPVRGGTHPAEPVEPAAAGAASSRHETGRFKMNLVSPGLQELGVKGERMVWFWWGWEGMLFSLFLLGEKMPLFPCNGCVWCLGCVGMI